MWFDNQVIKELTNGGADYCFECVGLASSMEDAFRSSREVPSVSSLWSHAHATTYIHTQYIYIFTATWHHSFGLNIYVDGIFPWGACMAVHCINIDFFSFMQKIIYIYIISKFWFRSYAESEVAEGTSYGRKSHFLRGGTI